MHKIYNALQAKITDEHTINNIGVPSLVLMERAALGVTESVLTRIREVGDTKVVCVCGKGNNGADGLCTARQLSEKGVEVSIYLCSGASLSSKTDDGSKAETKTDFETQLDICKKLNLHFQKNLSIPEGGIVVDAIFGNGLDREIGGAYAEAVKKINNAKAYVVSVDLPSGINATTGAVMGVAVNANETVTFEAERLGNIFYPGVKHTGELHICNIGWQTQGLDMKEPQIFCIDKEERELLPKRDAYSDKRSFGNALLVAGSKEYGGAAVLSADAAFAAGAGLVRVYTHEDNREPVLGRVAEAIVLDYDKGDFKKDNVNETLENLKKAVKNSDVTAAGSGLGRSEESAAILDCVIKNAGTELILDADAINLIAEGRADLKKAKAKDIVITPHIKEAARLLGEDEELVQADLISACRRLCDKFGVNVILKSFVTVISDGRDVFVNAAPNSGMAVAGSGDVLAGTLAGLAAQGLRGRELALAGVWLQCEAGKLARDLHGEYGMRPSDVAYCIRHVLKS